MSKDATNLIATNEAVARMVNLDYIPEGFTFLEMLDAFREEAEVNRDNAIVEKSKPETIEKLQRRLNVCTSRYELAENILKDINNDDDISENPQVVAMIDRSSIANWSAERYGLEVPAWETTPSENRPSKKQISWDSVTIKLRAEDRCSWSTDTDKGTATFAELNLIDRKTNTPNHQAGVLLGLSLGEKFPPGKKAKNKDRTALSKLRRSLKLFTGIDEDPFFGINDADGWKPRFKLIDDRANADKRAKERAMKANSRALDSIMPDFEEEDDDAAEFIKKNS